jgi:hypothetical protein
VLAQHVALARVGMHGREHMVIWRPGEYGILAHTPRGLKARSGRIGDGDCVLTRFAP